MLDLFLRHSARLIFADLPNRFHHAHEVLIRWKGHREICVVVVPLVSRDSAIVVATHAIEAIKELSKDLLSCLLSINEVLVLGHVVDCIDVGDSDCAAVVPVDELEGLVNHCLASLSERVSQSANELLICDVAIPVHIVVLHKGLDLNNLREETVSGERLGELSLIQLPVPVVVHAAEDDSEGADADATTLLDLHLELVVNPTNLNVKSHSVQLRHLVAVETALLSSLFL